MENIFKENRGGRVLFLGRITNFTDTELEDFLEDEGMKYASRYENQKDIVLVVLSSMLTPKEEQLSYDLYDMGVPDVSLRRFEEYFTKHIKPNSLVMSLKLSNDQDRLRRLLKNEALSDEVYLKLFKLYDWQDEGLYDNDNNRDITISFVKRFYRPDSFRDPAMIYAPTTVMNIAQETNSAEVLESLLSMPNHEIKISRKDRHRPRNIREIVALNESISTESIRWLMGFKNIRIDYFLASNSALTPNQQESIFQKANQDTKVMFAHNSNLIDSIFFKLLDEDEEIIKTLFSFQVIDKKRLEAILSKDLDSFLVAFLGDNQNIEEIDTLLELKNRDLDFKLASNPIIKESYLKKLYKRYGNSIASQISKNINISSDMAKSFYTLKDKEILKSLASNSSTPQNILDEMCELNDRELNELLASNPSVSLYYLQQFQLDSSLIIILANNPTYKQKILNNLGI